MFKNRNIQMLGTAILIVAAFLVTLSAVRPAAPANEEVLILLTGNEEGLAQYYLSERGAAAQNGLAVYHQSERMHAVNWTRSSDPLYKYHQSEWFGK